MLTVPKIAKVISTVIWVLNPTLTRRETLLWMTRRFNDLLEVQLLVPDSDRPSLFRRLEDCRSYQELISTLSSTPTIVFAARLIPAGQSLEDSRPARPFSELVPISRTSHKISRSFLWRMRAMFFWRLIRGKPSGWSSPMLQGMQT